MNRQLVLPTIIATVIGLAAVALLLFAWHLPPFGASDPSTENAYVRGKVTSVAPQLSGYLSEVNVVDFQVVKAGTSSPGSTTGSFASGWPRPRPGWPAPRPR